MREHGRFARDVAADAARPAAIGTQADQRLQHRRAVHAHEQILGGAVARVAVVVQHVDQVFRHRLLQLQEGIVGGHRTALLAHVRGQLAYPLQERVLAGEHAVAQAQWVRLTQGMGALRRHHALEHRAGKGAVQALVNFRQPRHGGEAPFVFDIVAAHGAQHVQAAPLEAQHVVARRHVAGRHLSLDHRFILGQEYRFIQAGRHDVYHVHRFGELAVLFVGHRGRYEDAQVTYALVRRIDDGLAAGHLCRIVLVQVQHPAQRLLRRGDVVTP